MPLPWRHLPDGRSTKRPVQIAPSTAALIERAHSARTGRGLHGLDVTHPRTINYGHGAKALGIGGYRRNVVGTAARRLRQSYQWDRGNGNAHDHALALPNPHCHT